MEEKYIIVNENDEQIGSKELEEIRQIDIYRVSVLWIENSKGEILLAQRSFSKDHDPGKWGSAVAGTVGVGEDYESNIYKEAEEEIGLTGEVFQKMNKVRRHGKYNFFLQRYYLKIDKGIEYFKIQEEEVEAIKWFSRREFKEELKNNPEKFLNNMEEALRVADEFKKTIRN